MCRVPGSGWGTYEKPITAGIPGPLVHGGGPFHSSVSESVLSFQEVQDAHSPPGAGWGPPGSGPQWEAHLCKDLP